MYCRVQSFTGSRQNVRKYRDVLVTLTVLSTDSPSFLSTLLGGLALASAPGAHSQGGQVSLLGFPLFLLFASDLLFSGVVRVA